MVTLPDMPCLEELRVSITVDSQWVAGGSPLAAMVAGDYITPAFSSISVFRLILEWKLSAQCLEDSAADRFVVRTPNGFGRLVDLLSNKRLLTSLREVELDFRPSCFGAGQIEEELAGNLRNRLRREAVEVFHAAVERVEMFSMITSNAFK